MLTIYKKDDTEFFQNINININTEQDLTGSNFITKQHLETKG